MPKFDNVSVVKKANVYFEGKCVSHTVYLPETDGVLHDWFRRHGSWAAIVRPDHYVYATPAHAAGLVGELDALGVRLRPEHGAA